MNTRMKLAATLSLAATLTAAAEIKINDNFSVSGYIEGSYQYNSPTPGKSSDTFNIDSSQLLFTTSFKPVTGVMSFFYVPNAPSETTVLDAYVTYDAGGGVTVTGGKFLSYMGYESFFTVNNPEITFANGDYIGVIPGYHEGVKVDYSTSDFGLGAALLDSVYSGPNYLKGDGELKHNAGFEGYFTYKGVKDFTFWSGFAYDTKGSFQPHSVLSLDFWGQYQVSPTIVIAGEFANKDAATGASGSNWLGLVTYAFTPRFSTAFRVSGEKVKDGGPSFTRFTIAPGIAITDHLTVRAEYTYTDYTNDASIDRKSFFGVQAYYKF